jgi:phage gpG-like protein
LPVFEIKVDSTLQLVLQQLQHQAQSIHNALPIIAEMLVAGVHDVFEAEGPGWAPLAEATLRARRGGGAGAKILQDTGMMSGSISPGWGDNYAEAFAGVSYAIYHVSKEPRHHLPLRDFFNLGPYEQPILNEVAELLTNQLA